ncbi:MAG: hypothetical protein H6548_01670 [Chitinophagales bacterium]|nr:hypothetical protein [Chitinophagales bacterium]HAE12862.1 hypothetical protein [Bacteroidota bacterium]MCB9020802.1 hypothetical protein [Chitinophagales bacterium]MCB9031280.1 hypothetical protein [Chitinophagales bacterium]HAE35399.1 hypothetical protein [Bacteroidota bacterium]
MFKYTPNNLKKLESLLGEAGYIIRYEKGRFVSGYCILENRKVIVVNKYFEVESRINSLLEIMGQLPLEEEQLSDAARDFLRNNHLQSVRV